MKIEKSDLHLLFAPSGKPSAQAASPAPAASATRPPSAAAAPVAPPAPTPDISGRAGAPEPNESSALLAMLKAVTRSMWRKLESEGVASRREQRKRLLELLQWYCGKNGLAFEENTRQPYLHNRSRIEGRLHATIGKGTARVAVEVCFALEHAALQKLRNAHSSGSHPLLVWAGSPAARADLLARVAQLTGNPATSWLELVSVSDPAQGPK